LSLTAKKLAKARTRKIPVINIRAIQQSNPRFLLMLLKPAETMIFVTAKIRAKAKFVTILGSLPLTSSVTEEPINNQL
jgi:hypothetical protein